MAALEIFYTPDAPLSEIIVICKHLFPEWRSLLDTDFSVTAVPGGITNILYKVQPSDQKAVLFRVYGPNLEEMIDREQEIRRMRHLFKIGIGAEVLATFGNGRVESFLESRTLEVHEMGHPSAIPKIAALVADFHNVSLEEGEEESRDSQLFKTLSKWSERVAGIEFKDPKKQKFFHESFNVTSLTNDLDLIIKSIKIDPTPIVHGHNDLLNGNILVLKEGDQPIELDRSRFTLIDFEYAAYMPRGYDIADHFNEYAGFDGDLIEAYPTEKQQRLFIACYLDHSVGRPNVADRPTVESMLDEVRRFSPLSHMYWGLWAIIQSSISSNDFDYLSYALARLNYFHLEKERIISVDKKNR